MIVQFIIVIIIITIKITMIKLLYLNLYFIKINIFKYIKYIGPESIGFDISFPGFKDVYGIPQHTSPLDLKTTRYL